MSTNPYAPPQEQSEADPVEELCVRAPDLRDEIQAARRAGNTLAATAINTAPIMTHKSIIG